MSKPPGMYANLFRQPCLIQQLVRAMLLYIPARSFMRCRYIYSTYKQARWCYVLGMKRFVSIQLGSSFQLILSWQCYNCGEFGTERFKTEISAWHFVQIFDGHHFEFYRLPTIEELLQTDGPLRASKTHTITLPSNFIKTIPFARSATSYMVLFRDDPPNKFVLFNIHLSPSGAVATLDSEYQIPGNPQSRVAMPDFAPTSPTSSPRLGVTMSFAATGNTLHLHPLWICLKRDFGEEAGRVVTTMPEFVLPSFDYPPFAMYIRYADPFSGRIAAYVADGAYGGDTYKLMVIDYVPLPR